jgi:hypothetical protein
LIRSSMVSKSVQNSHNRWIGFHDLSPYRPVSTFSLWALMQILATQLLPPLDGMFR